MFLRAGLLALALLLASRLLGLVRESALAASYGATGLGDIAVLMFSLPDWITSAMVGGALSYVLVPAWAGQGGTAVAASQRRVARVLLAGSLAAGFAFAAASPWLVDLLAAGTPDPLRSPAVAALAWSGAALPLAVLAALWATRLQHERDFPGLYAANLVVNGVLIATLAVAPPSASAVAVLGAGLLLAMGARLGWQAWRLRRSRAAGDSPATVALPAWPSWTWAALAAGLPLALPFAARSMASRAGEGALATFNYAWKLAELPLVLVIQLVATLALPAVSRVLAPGATEPPAPTVRAAFATAWAAACAAAAGLTLAAPAAADLLFGWGRMQPDALAHIAAWGAVAAWGLLPQALVAVATTILAAQRRMQVAAAAYGLALAVLLAAAAGGVADGGGLMRVLNGLFALLGLVLTWVAAGGRGWLPWRAFAVPAAALAALQALHPAGWLAGLAAPALLFVGVLGASVVLLAAWLAGPDLRRGLAR